MEEALKDERFSHILTDPRFRKMPKHVRKMTIDKRFKRMLKDESFKEKCTLDKRGRPMNLTPSENLKKLYDMSSESSEDDAEEEEEAVNENHGNIDRKKELSQKVTSTKELDSAVKKLNEKSNESMNIKGKDKKRSTYGPDTSENTSDDSDNSESDDNMEDQIDTQKIRENEKKASSPGKDADENTSEESDESDSESDDNNGKQSEDFDHRWEELRNEAPDTSEITRRIAVCNMDWDRIRAVDLFVCFDSFKPSNGSIDSVKIYPSEYGLKRMEEEKLKGPPELVEKTLASDEEEHEDIKGAKYHTEKLRQYQISRLKYYYAVIDCDSPETANVLYEQLNGMEYESSSVRFDLRFVPDDFTFDHEPTSVTDKCPDLTEYIPRQFVTSALQQMKVDLTWDETNPKRREFFQKIFTDPDSVQSDIQNYLASGSSESEVEENVADEEPDENLKTKDRITKYRELMLSLEEKEKQEEEEKNQYDVEVTFVPALKERTEEQVKEKIKKESMNPFEEMLQKKKDDRKMKKKGHKDMQKQAEDSLSDDSEEEFSKNTSMSNEKAKDEKRLAELALISDSKKETDFEGKFSKKNKKAKSKDVDNFVGDPNDPRFSAMYTSSLFNVAPSDQHAKKNEGKFGVKSEKRKMKSGKFNKYQSTKRPKY